MSNNNFEPIKSSKYTSNIQPQQEKIWGHLFIPALESKDKKIRYQSIDDQSWVKMHPFLVFQDQDRYFFYPLTSRKKWHIFKKWTCSCNIQHSEIFLFNKTVLLYDLSQSKVFLKPSLLKIAHQYEVSASEYCLIINKAVLKPIGQIETVYIEKIQKFWNNEQNCLVPFEKNGSFNWK